MRAMLCHGFEGIGSLRFGETAEPIPAPDEVAVDVHAASVSYMDYLMVSGGYQLRPPLSLRPRHRRSRSSSGRWREGHSARSG